MDKILSNTFYKLKYQIWWMLIYVLIAVFVLAVVYTLLFKTGVLTSSTGSLGYRLWGMLLFQFAVSIRFKEDFDLFLTLSNTRKEFLMTQLAAAGIFSLLIALCVVIEKAVIDSLNTVFALPVKEFFHMIAVYRNSNFLQIFTFFALLSFVLSVSGLLLGSLFYHFGKIFTTVFWFVMASIPVFGIPLLVWPFGNESYMSDFIRITEEFFIAMNVNNAMIFIIILSVPIVAITHLSVNTLSQK